MPHPETPTKRPVRFRSIVLVPVFALVALLCWAFASPIGSSPDDDYHLTSIWCGLGDRPGLCESVPGHPEERVVPFAAGQTNCNRHFAGSTSTCPIDGLSPDSPIVTSRGNFLATYPPVYYAFMGLFASTNYTVAALVMRIVNIVLFVGLSSLLYFLLAPIRRRTLLWAWSIVIVPLGAFLIASNNPSAWAVISGGILWLALVGYFEQRGWRSIVLGCTALVALIMGAGARADSAIYAVVAVGVAVFMTAEKTRLFLLKAIAPAVFIVIAIAFYLTSNQSTVASGGLSGEHAASTAPGVTLIWNNLLQLPGLWAGVLGTWGLGWLDTIMPAVVPILGLLAFGAVTFTGLVSITVRKVIALAGVGALLVAIPSWILYKGHATVGQEVQPRYILPLVIIFAGVALLQAGPRLIRFTRVQTIVVIIAVGIANAVALHVTMHRYISGPGMDGLNLNHNVQWWWHVPISPTVVWAIGSLAFAAALAVALWQPSDRIVPVDAGDRPRPVAA